MPRILGPVIYVGGLTIVVAASLLLGEPHRLGAQVIALAYLIGVALNSLMATLWPASAFRETRADFLAVISIAALALLLNQLVFGPATQHGAAGLRDAMESVRSAPDVQGIRFIGQLLAFLLLYEALGFAQHWLSHTVRPLWTRIHSLHHEPRQYGLTVALRFHYLEFFIAQFTRSFILFFLQADPVVIAIVMSIGNYTFAIVHTNTRLSFAPVNRVFNTPDFHIWHHDKDRRVNYSVGMFVLFDQLARTYWCPGPDRRPAELGIDDVQKVRSGTDTLLLRPLHSNPAAPRGAVESA